MLQGRPTNRFRSRPARQSQKSSSEATGPLEESRRGWPGGAIRNHLTVFTSARSGRALPRPRARPARRPDRSGSRSNSSRRDARCACGTRARPELQQRQELSSAPYREGEDRYHVRANTCEHFCERCLRGEHRSYPVDRWLSWPLRAWKERPKSQCPRGAKEEDASSESCFLNQWVLST